MAGPDDGLLCVFHGGTPSAALRFGPSQDAIVAAGMRYVTYSRPGYAGSDPDPGRTVADAAGDVGAILGHLGVDRFVTLGWSGVGVRMRLHVRHCCPTDVMRPQRWPG